MKLKLPSCGETDVNLHKATFAQHQGHLKNDKIEGSGNDNTKFSVKATLFDEGTLKTLLKEKSSLSQLEASFGEESDDDFLAPKKTAIFRSKRLQNKRKRKDIGKEETKPDKMSKGDNEQKLLGNGEDNNVCDKQGEDRPEIEGL